MKTTRIKKADGVRRFKWIVEFEVDETWVEDGFDLDDERALKMLNADLSYAYEHELGAKVIAKPPESEIRKSQGYIEGAA